MGDNPAPAQFAGHAHGFQHLRIAEGSCGQPMGRDARPARLGQALGGGAVVQHGEEAGEQAAAQSQQPVIGMKQRGADAVDGHPRHIAERGEPRPGGEVPHRVEIAQRLGLGRIAIAHRHALDGVEHLAIHPAVEGYAGPFQQPRPQPVQRRPDHVEEDRDEGEQRQRLKAAARQDAVIDLHHVERGVQPQKIDEEAEDDDRDEGGADRPQGKVQRRWRPGPRRLCRHTHHPQPSARASPRDQGARYPTLAPPRSDATVPPGRYLPCARPRLGHVPGPLNDASVQTLGTARFSAAPLQMGTSLPSSYTASVPEA